MSIISSSPFTSIGKQALTIIPVFPQRKLKTSKAELPERTLPVIGLVLKASPLTSSRLFHFHWPGTFHQNKAGNCAQYFRCVRGLYRDYTWLPCFTRLISDFRISKITRL